MKLFRLLLAIGLSLFSTAVMSYISMAIPIGPWMESTLVLAGMVIISICGVFMPIPQESQTLGLSTVAGGIGGILATGFGFSFPMLYFTAPDIFNHWLEYPLYFSALLSVIAFSAGSLGLLVAHVIEHRLIVEYDFAFPIGSMVNKMISAQNQFNKALQLAIGFVSTQMFLVAKKCFSIIPHSIVLLNKNTLGLITIPSINIPLGIFPMLIAIGFITGHVIAIPLGVGVLVKNIIMEPLYYFYSSSLSAMDFTIAFSTGIVLYSALMGLLTGFPKLFKSLYKVCNQESSQFKDKQSASSQSWKESLWCSLQAFIQKAPLLQIIAVIVSFFAIMLYFDFSFVSQIYLFLFTIVCCYQLAEIAGKIGLAPLGRFATFVLVPGLLFFGYNAIQAMVVSTFVEVAGGVTCDALFGRKFAHLAKIERKKVVYYQWLGLVVSSFAIGIFFWFLITQFGVATPELPVQKALSRALLVNAQSFNIAVSLIGAFFAYIISRLKINPILMLGGVLMPESMSIILILGGGLAYFMYDKEEWYPFWSGVFAANSLWMLIQSLFDALCS